MWEWGIRIFLKQRDGEVLFRIPNQFSLLNYFVKNDEIPLLCMMIVQTIVALGWGVATATALAVLYGLEEQFKLDGEQLSLTASAIYGGFHRTAWALSLAWLVFACVNGYGGILHLPFCEKSDPINPKFESRKSSLYLVQGS